MQHFRMVGPRFFLVSASFSFSDYSARRTARCLQYHKENFPNGAVRNTRSRRQTTDRSKRNQTNSRAGKLHTNQKTHTHNEQTVRVTSWRCKRREQSSCLRRQIQNSNNSSSSSNKMPFNRRLIPHRRRLHRRHHR